MRGQRKYKIAAGILTIGIVVVIVGYAWYYQMSTAILDPLPAPNEAPEFTVASITVGNLILNASAGFHLFFPHQGPLGFGFSLSVNVSNTGASDISDFHVVKATVFRSNLTPIFTFGVNSDNSTIGAGANRVLTYEESTDLARGTLSLSDNEFFLRVLVTFDVNNQAILTTPLSGALIAIE
ncbi:MAG: hypothetical protein ACE5H4_15895 [Candidatus Thorarchaeota archaeon]